MERRGVNRLAVVVVSILVAAGTAHAAQRTFVASTGSDLNPCSLTQPCRSFGAAIVNTSGGGDIVTLDSAGYGPVVIDKPLSIVVPSGIYAGVSVNGAAVDGIVVNVNGGPVSLRGLQISSQGGTNGVRIQQGYEVILENVQISGFYASSNGHAILQAATTPSSLLIRNSIIRDGDSGIVVDGTTANKSVTIEGSVIEGFFNGPCIGLTDSINMIVRNSLVSDCNTGFALTQPAASFGYMSLLVENTTLARIGPNPAVKVINNATDRAPNLVISNSHVFNTNGVSVTNGNNVAIDRSTFDSCGPGACLDASGTQGFINLEVMKTELRHTSGGIRMVGNGTMGGNIGLTDSRITNTYPNEAIYMRGNTVGYINLVAKGSTINYNKKGIVVDSYSAAKLTTNQIVFNAGGGLFKSAGGINQYIESSNDNYVTSNGWEPGSSPDAVPATIQLR